MCWPAAQLQAARRRYGLLHEERPFHDGSFERWTKNPSSDFPFHYLDGVTIWLSPTELSPDDDFLASAAGSREEVAGESDEPSDRE